MGLGTTYQWDEQKNEANTAKHGIDFVDAQRVFASLLLTVLDDREDYGEDRWIGLGLLDGRVVYVVYTEPREDTIRLISARKALAHEQKQYEKHLKNELGTSGQPHRRSN